MPMPSRRRQTAPSPAPVDHTPNRPVTGPLKVDGPQQRPSSPPREGRIEDRPIAGLTEHPRQKALFHDIEGAELEDLVASLRREGLREPIWVTPDGVIVNGHQRVRAAAELGVDRDPGPRA